MSSYSLDVTNVAEDMRGSLSYELHKLQHTCLDIKKVGNKDIGMVVGDTPRITAEILQKKGYDVSVYSGCGHCLQGMPNTGGRCDCECHS